MKFQDSAAIIDLLADYIGRVSRDHEDTSAKSRKAALGRRIEKAEIIIAGLQKARAAELRSIMKGKPEDIAVGKCPCGADITLGPKYTVAPKSSKKIERACRCGRTNVVTLTASVEVQPSSWKLGECTCGEPMYASPEYAGVGFQGYRGFPIIRPDSYKTRRFSLKCRACGCDRNLTISFVGGNGEPVKPRQDPKSRLIDAKVRRCDGCRRKIEREAATS